MKKRRWKWAALVFLSALLSMRGNFARLIAQFGNDAWTQAYFEVKDALLKLSFDKFWPIVNLLFFLVQFRVSVDVLFRFLTFRYCFGRAAESEPLPPEEKRRGGPHSAELPPAPIYLLNLTFLM